MCKTIFKQENNFGAADPQHLLWLNDRHLDFFQEVLSFEGLSLAAATTESLESESDLMNLSDVTCDLSRCITAVDTDQLLLQILHTW